MAKNIRDISSLEVWDKNPRSVKKENFERLIAQIKRLGKYKPLLITSEGIVIGGNMRLRALRQLGVKKVAVNEVEFQETDEGWVALIDGVREGDGVFESKEQGMTEYAISDNDRVGDTDEQKLAELIIDNPGLDIEIYRVDLGTPASLDKIISKFGPDAEEIEVPDVPDEGVSEVGQVYLLGQHRLMVGDATNTEDVAKLMGDHKADMVFTDPPYNVDYGESMKDKVRGNTRKIMNDNLGTGFYQFLYDAMENLMVHNKGAFYICMSSSELHTLYQAFKDAGGHWSTFIIWAKNTFTMGRADYQRQYEPILYGWKEGTDHYWSGARDIGDVWQVDRPTKNDLHPTMKPIELVSKAIKNSSKTEDIVLDTFGGSGSTLIAAEQLGRRCFMMELDPRFADVIRKRYVLLTGGDEDKWEELTPNENS